MASPAQNFANRENSKHSTGPRTPEGKSASRENAKTHGFNAADPVLPHEDRSQFNGLLENYIADFAPRTAAEKFLVVEIAGAQWKLNRLERIEVALLSPLIDPADPTTSDAMLAQSFTDDKAANALARLDRYRNNLQRVYHRCLAQLRAARKLQNEADSTEMAETKFQKLVQRMAENPPPGYEVQSHLVPVDADPTEPAANPGS